MVTLVDSMMIISETLSAQSMAGTKSKKTSGRGLLDLSGIRSCVSDNDVVDRIKLKDRHMKAATNNQTCKLLDSCFSTITSSKSQINLKYIKRSAIRRLFQRLFL